MPPIYLESKSWNRLKQLGFRGGAVTWSKILLESDLTAHKAADDHTIYLLADGTRGLTGNLAVTAGKTIDGVDVSAISRKHILTFYLPNAEVGQNVRWLGYSQGSQAWKLPFAATLTKLSAFFYPTSATNRVWASYYNNGDEQVAFDTSNSPNATWIRLEVTNITYPNFALGDNFSMALASLNANISQLSLTAEFTEV